MIVHALETAKKPRVSFNMLCEYPHVLAAAKKRILQPEWADHKISEEALGLRRIENS